MSRVFDGSTSSHLSHAGSSIFTPGTASGFCWFKPSAISGRLISRWFYGYLLHFGSPFVVSFNVIHNPILTGFGVNTDTAPSTGVWQCAGFRSTTATISVFFNGVVKDAAAGSSDNQYNGNSFAIGADPDNTAPYTGKIAEVALWNSYLSPVDFSGLSGGQWPETVSPNSLIGCWPLLGRDSPEPSTGSAPSLSIGTTTGDPSDHPIPRTSGIAEVGHIGVGAGW